MPNMGDCPTPTKPSPVSMASLVHNQKLVLEEFLNEDPDMNDTIANLTQLLKHLETAPVHTVSSDTLLNIRRALHSLTILHDLCVG